MSRRDTFKTLGAGLGAAAAVSQASPAMAVLTAIDVKQNYQDRLNIIRAEKNAVDGQSPYAKLMVSASKPAGVEKYSAPSGNYYSNGKSEDGVSFRKPNEPNACSEVRAAHDLEVHFAHNGATSSLDSTVSSASLESDDSNLFACAGVQGEAPFKVRLLSIANVFHGCSVWHMFLFSFIGRMLISIVSPTSVQHQCHEPSYMRMLVTMGVTCAALCTGRRTSRLVTCESGEAGPGVAGAQRRSARDPTLSRRIMMTVLKGKAVPHART